MSETEEFNLADVEIQVVVDSDGSKASVVIPAIFDPEMLDAKMLATIAHTSDVKIDATSEKRLQEIVENFIKCPHLLEEVFAEAVPATNGEDGRIEWVEEYNPNIDHNDRPENGDDGIVDYYNQTNYMMVLAETHVATHYEPTDGEDGHDVRGQVIKAKPGKKSNLRLDQSVLMDSDGRIVTQIEGRLEFDKDFLRVTRMLEVPAYVDFSTGNIDFDGSVHVKSGIRDRFEVKTTENIVVDELIEAATIKCGGSFTARRGMAARDRGLIFVHGSAQVGFLNYVKGVIRGNLTVQKEIVNCELAIGKDLNMESGTILGGKVAITGSVHVGVIGSDSELPTVIVLGSAPLLTQQLKKIEDLVKEYEKKVEELKGEYKTLKYAGATLSHQLRERLTEIDFEISEATDNMNKYLSKQNEIQKVMDETRKVDININKIIYPKTTLRIGTNEATFEKLVKGPVNIGWDINKHLVFRQGSSDVIPLCKVARTIDHAA